MQLQLLTLIPALATIIWALAVKFKDGHVFEGIVLSISAVAVVINGLVVLYSIFLHGTCPDFLHFIQIVTSSSIVPLAYMYFSRQMGRRFDNATAVICWSLVLFVFMPNVNIFVGSDQMPASEPIRSFSFNIIRNGVIVFSCYTSNLVIFLQALLTVGRMIPTAMTLRTYGLSLTTKMKCFFVWWASAVLFIVVTSFSSADTLLTPAGSWAFYITYTLLICSIYSMLAMHFDLHPVVLEGEDGEEDEVVEVDEFINANKALAVRLRTLMDNEKVFLQSGYSAEDAALALGTNRTYFSRMMNAEFGMKFSDLVTEYRIKEAKELLANPDFNISDVAFQSGFSDASYMNKKFHQLVGMTPRQYREHFLRS